MSRTRGARNPRQRRLHGLQSKRLLFLSGRKRSHRPDARVARPRRKHLIFSRFVAAVWANPALSYLLDKIEKFASWLCPFHLAGVFESLSRIQSAQVKQFERAFDFIALRGGKSSAAETDNVQSEHSVALGRERERRQIFAESRASLDDHKSPHAHILVKSGAAAEKRLIVDRDIAAEQNIIRDNHLVADDTIMANMRANHQE